MNTHLVNRITAWLVFLPWIVYAVWEITVIALRTKYPEVRTISMEARSIASRGLSSLAYVFAGMAVHYFVNWKRFPLSGWVGVVAGILWWAGLAAYLASDIFTPEARVWIRQTWVAAMFGGVGAFFLFGQNAIWAVP